MAGNEIEQSIQEAIAHGDLKEYFAKRWPVPPGREAQSPYTRKLVDEIVHAFPRRLKTTDMAERLGRSPRWLQKLCRHAFGLTYVHLLRRLWVYQALRLMQQTSFDNGEIALHLNYMKKAISPATFGQSWACLPLQRAGACSGTGRKNCLAEQI